MSTSPDSPLSASSGPQSTPCRCIYTPPPCLPPKCGCCLRPGWAGHYLEPPQSQFTVLPPEYVACKFDCLFLRGARSVHARRYTLLVRWILNRVAFRGSKAEQLDEACICAEPESTGVLYASRVQGLIFIVRGSFTLAKSKCACANKRCTRVISLIESVKMVDIKATDGG